MTTLTTTAHLLIFACEDFAGTDILAAIYGSGHLLPGVSSGFTDEGHGFAVVDDFAAGTVAENAGAFAVRFDVFHGFNPEGTRPLGI